MLFDVATSHDAVVGDYQVKGAIGDKVTANLLVRDKGPASLDFLGGDFVDGILVTVPEWATVTDAPEECFGTKDPSDLPLSAGRASRGPLLRVHDDLDSSYLKIGDNLRFAFTFKITADHGANGSYSIQPNSGAGTGDTDRSNNTAKITLDVVGGDGSLPVTGSKVGMIGGVGGALLLVGVILVVVGRRRKRTIAA